MTLQSEYDVTIIGGGPAGLSAALVLGRSRRSVLVVDDGRPRNRSASELHGYLGLKGIPPKELRARGRAQAISHGAQMLDAEVTDIKADPSTKSKTGFRVVTNENSWVCRKILFATGVKDQLPEIEYLRDFYGTHVFHCPYCDGWEHTGKKVAVVAEGDRGAKFALLLHQWTSDLVLCSKTDTFSEKFKTLLTEQNISVRIGNPSSLLGDERGLKELAFSEGPSVPCDALFFHTIHNQRSLLPEKLGCHRSEDGSFCSKGNQCSSVPGVFFAGDADGDVEFAIVAASEGAVAAMAINQELVREEQNW